MKLRQLLAVLFAFALLLFAGWSVYRLGKAFFAYVNGIPKEVGASLVAGVATILVATLTVVLGRYFERKKELDALYREKKTEMYDEFLRRLFQLFHNSPKPGEVDPTPDKDQDEMVQFLREFHRKQILWSGPEVIRSFGTWREHLVRGVPDADSFFLMEDFLLSVRRDLRQSNTGLGRGFFVKIFLTQGDLFLEKAAKNPKMTLTEFSQFEKSLERKPGTTFGAGE